MAGKPRRRTITVTPTVIDLRVDSPAADDPSLVIGGIHRTADGTSVGSFAVNQTFTQLPEAVAVAARVIVDYAESWLEEQG